VSVVIVALRDYIAIRDFAWKAAWPGKEKMGTNILFIGDIVGKGGRKAVVAMLPELLDTYECSFCIANAENVAGGAGITKRTVLELTNAGVNVFTSGDHVWDQRDFVVDINALPNVLRPENVNPVQPGRGMVVFPLPSGERVAVLSLMGRTFLNNQTDCPFQAADRVLPELAAQTSIIVVDFHAEATSEKIALGRYLDGRVSAVLGTHTHVVTADETIFPGGTAFQCDVGMVGGRCSILGREVEPVLKRFSTGMPARFKVVEKGIRLHGTVVHIGDDGHATGIERVVRDAD